ncbi:uncharacterized protein [Physcomitrium patens]|uniref:Uncharacterized protein n=1 Tax=Physcomitrium patens TaxID=3218 RepID=A9SNJ0_PHYPA|nr:zinc finger protein 341-like [Physcomitrium patens]PNR36251.1 hypothetical protein PHYPA_022102 [Physcomitrium patens]|eukprot:XP_024400418.1 zinc finger protein 341-like [Physcomitrella patens]
MTEQKRLRLRSWRVAAAQPQFCIKLIALALVASTILTLSSSSALILAHSGNLRQSLVTRRSLLQASRERPAPTGYPPPVSNGHNVDPQAPSSRRRPFEDSKPPPPPPCVPPPKPFYSPPVP